MRPLALLVALAVSGCSLADGDPAFRVLASVDARAPLGGGSVRAALTPAEGRALADAVGLPPFDVDYAREAVIAVGTPGACPATNYEVAVLGVVPTATGALVRAEVRRTGDGGGDVLTYPVAVVAAAGVGSVDVGDAPAALVALDRIGVVDECGLQAD